MLQTYLSHILWEIKPRKILLHMLVLSRKPKESVVINGNVTVSILRVDNDNVRIGIEAPKEVNVMRYEIYEEIRKNNQMAADSSVTKMKDTFAYISGDGIKDLDLGAWDVSNVNTIQGMSHRTDKILGNGLSQWDIVR